MVNDICCPLFNPDPWDDRIFEWNDRRFIRDKVMTLFYMPLNFGNVMRRLDALMGSAGATAPDNMNLSDHVSKWKTDLYVAVDNEVPGAENVGISGKFYSKVYEGPFKDAGRWMEDFNTVVKDKGFNAKKVYSWYTTCPKCAKEHGKNHVVLFAEIG